jgi:hypothetical protein
MGIIFTTLDSAPVTAKLSASLHTWTRVSANTDPRVMSGEDHAISGEDHVMSGEDHVVSGEDHGMAGEDHVMAGEDPVYKCNQCRC